MPKLVFPTRTSTAHSFVAIYVSIAVIVFSLSSCTPSGATSSDSNNEKASGKIASEAAHGNAGATRPTGANDSRETQQLQDHKDSNELKRPVGVDMPLPPFSSLATAAPHQVAVVALGSIEKDGGDYRAILSVDQSGRVLLWDTLHATPYKLFVLGEKFQSVQLFPEQNALVALDTGSVRIYELSGDGRPFRTLTKIPTRFTAASVQASGKSVLLGGADGSVYRWLLTEDEREQFLHAYRSGPKDLQKYAGPATVVSAVLFHPSGRLFFTGDWNGVLTAWLTYESDPFGGKFDENVFGSGIFADKASKRVIAPEEAQTLTAMRVAHHGEYLFTALQNGKIEWWSIRGMKKLSATQVTNGLLYDLAVNSDGSRVATVSRDGKVRVIKTVLQPIRLQTPKPFAMPEPEYSFAADFEAEVPGGRVLSFASDGKLYAGDLQGKVAPVAPPSPVASSPGTAPPVAPSGPTN